MILSGAIIPFNRLIQQQKIAINWADFIETVASYFVSVQDGRLYSMPFNVTTPILYYNKDIFKKAGLDEKPPATWADVEAVSRKIIAAGTAKCGFTTTFPAFTLLETTFAWHDQPYTTNQNGYGGVGGNRLFINRDFGLMHVGALARWQKENIYSYGGRFRQAASKFINGDCAMLVDSSSFVGLHEDGVKFAWGTGQFPHWGPPYPKTNTIVTGGSLWVLRGRDAADYKGVAQFLKFIAEPQQQIWWAATTGYMPTTKAAVKNLKDGAFSRRTPSSRRP
jgi:sn-glycerol 3-phosphate transport system substrate-binding protein